MTLDDIETPAVLIYRDRVEENLRRAQDYADAHGLTLRPHIKTHKLPSLAARQVELGACGITCQKLGEAEVMADAGLTDILLTFNILGAAKLKRLKALNERVTLAVVADSAEAVAGYAETFAGAAKPLTVLVECDTGMGRCGVQSAEEALTLARRIDAAEGLRFGGLMTYPPAGRPREAADWLANARRLLEDAGLDVPAVTSGGTPDIWQAHEAATAITEYRPGTYIYMDRSLVARGVCDWDACALRVLTTVVSAPTADRVVLDAGSKTLSSDTLGLNGFGYLPAYPEARIAALSEEHGVVDVSACGARPAIGERLEVIPNHACVVTNLFDAVHVVAGDGTVERVLVAARGRVD
ncbi:D-TA family PLP-dependent enzyme [Rhodobium gokarnense]|uniref:D-serine deaminase-like pyridoxal phosphate-dependent protein n=1 Tax=Rhodobium gokarnense TaxID=364296 RepID=A0ABT3HC43_9HYPH|nr:D-TA family PLP-dependent enzyme [Rhodobium gokarnense]MCW2307974.1 D-serine deaminase-like pyridoxal phosphate-dependent protein [Rhodobium gokarnense]